MSEADRPSGEPSAGAAFPARAGWALFDFAHQPFLTLGTFVIAPYVATRLAADAAEGQALWGLMLGISGIVVAVLSPILGAAADASGRRKSAALATSAVTAAGAAALWFAVPGTPGALVLALVAFGVATVGSEFAAVFNNAMLPRIGGARMGRLSGIAWGLGYLGGLLALLLVLAGFVLPATPLLGLDRAAGETARIAGPLAAVWLVVFLIPFWVATPDAPAPEPARRGALREALARLAATVRSARRLGNVVRFLLARMLYQDGLSALLAFSGIYAASRFGWPADTVGLFAVVLLAVSVPGSLLGGVVDDRLGPRLTVVLSLLLLIAGAAGILAVAPDRIGFIAVAPPVPGGPPFAAAAELAFLGFGVLVGLAVGPVQAASRTLLARLAPAGMTAEFFGLYALSGKATAFLGPLLIAAVTAATGDERAGLLVVLAFLLAGLGLLLTVSERPPPG